MKKIYIQPEMLTVKLCACAIIANSPNTIDINSVGGSGSDLTKDEGDWDDDLWDE